MLDPRRAYLTTLAVALIATAAVPSVASCPDPASETLGTAIPVMDGNPRDWCFSATSNSVAGVGRFDDCSTTLTCGRCSLFDDESCAVDADCETGQTCVDPGSRSETVWWDARADAAVNDLSTLALTHDDDNLYVVLDFWNQPDPVSLPFIEVAIDVMPGGIGAWYDPMSALTDPGRCSVSTDRGCTSDADCHFCAISTEPSPSTRPRVCGSDDPVYGGFGTCSFVPGDVCDPSQVCVGTGGQGSVNDAGDFSVPLSRPDYLLVYDFSRWLIGLEDAVQLMKDVGGSWTAIAQFAIVVSPGTGSGPPPAVEISVPWSAFGCTGCPAACSCPDFGPGQSARFSFMVARGLPNFDYIPDGAIEDVPSEANAGTATTTSDNCTGIGIGIDTLYCEIADGSTDAFFPPLELPGGRSGGLTVARDTHDATPMLTLIWEASCSSRDTDYAVYGGTLGAWYSHQPVDGTLCSTAGNTSVSFETEAGDRYYVVVPGNGVIEGSYGVDGGGQERPVGFVSCAPQGLGSCP